MGNLKEEEMKAELSKEAWAIIEYKDYIINNQRKKLAAAQRDMELASCNPCVVCKYMTRRSDKEPCAVCRHGSYGGDVSLWEWRVDSVV